jgi:hypothetical protein
MVDSLFYLEYSLVRFMGRLGKIDILLLLHVIFMIYLVNGYTTLTHSNIN